MSGVMAVTTSRARSPHEFQSFDLAPPPPNKHLTTIDKLSHRLFSDDHLSFILHDPTQFLRFTAFINKHRVQTAPILARYLETQKAIKAVEYANAIANTIEAVPQDHSTFIPSAAALLDVRFEARNKAAFEILVNDGLSAYVTRVLVDAVADTMVKEITGNTLPIMRDLVGGLAEVFCLTDPSMKDNPIVYASEEFYRTTQYGRDYAIGRNCRFLQGPKTDRSTIARISAACQAGQEICETVLNYRRDGSPFLNLLMIAPLFDNRGHVRYFIGAQVDVTGLVEDGRGIESFEGLLADDRAKADVEEATDRKSKDMDTPKRPIEVLGELGEMLSSEETMEIQSRSRSASLRDDISDNSGARNSGGAGGRRDLISMRAGGRRVLGDDADPEALDKAAWGLSGTGMSGKLPGVYQNYLLVRPYPSLRIIFVSPALRIPGLLQSHFLSRIGGPASIRDGIEDAFASGVPVTAKVAWLPLGKTSSEDEDDDIDRDHDYRNGNSLNAMGRDRDPHSWDRNNSLRNGAIEASPPQPRTRWLSCTPLLGSDDAVGVWMVVMVEDNNPSRVVTARSATAATSHSNGMGSIDSTASRKPPTAFSHNPYHALALRASDREREAASRSRPTDTVRTTDFAHRGTEPQQPSPHSQQQQHHHHQQQQQHLQHAPITARTSSRRGTVHTTSDARSPGSWSPTLSPTLSSTAVESWIPSVHATGSSTHLNNLSLNPTLNASPSHPDLHGAKVGVNGGGSVPGQGENVFAEFAARMTTGPRTAAGVISDKGVNFRNGRVLDGEVEDARRVMAQMSMQADDEGVASGGPGGDNIRVPGRRASVVAGVVGVAN